MLREKYRILRGGSWGSYDTVNLRLTHRGYFWPTDKGYGVGFRCTWRKVDAKEKKT